MTSRLDNRAVPVHAPKTGELIAAQIRSKIVRGELTAGSALASEAVLMSEFGVSRPTLREAFRILEAESLLVVRRGARGGARILAPTPAVATRHVGVLLQLRGTSAGDVHDARSAVEPPCAEAFARRGSRQEFDAFHAAASVVAAAVSADTWTWSTAVGDFRRQLLTAGSSPATALLGGLIVELGRAQVGLDVTPARKTATARACTDLADLVSARSGLPASRHWQEHLAADAPSDRRLETLSS